MCASSLHVCGLRKLANSAEFMPQHILLLPRAEPSAQPQRLRIKPSLRLVAMGQGTLFIRASMHAGQPFNVITSDDFELGTHTEQTQIAQFDLTQTAAQFEANLTLILQRIREEAEYELAHKRMLDTTAADAGLPIKKRATPRNIGLSVTLFVQPKTGPQWRDTAHEIIPATQINLSLPVHLSPQRAKHRLDIALEAIRRIANKAKEHGL